MQQMTNEAIAQLDQKIAATVRGSASILSILNLITADGRPPRLQNWR
jgi:hypothetical protein